MANVIKFPVKAARDKALVAQGVRELFIGTDANEDAIDAIIEKGIGLWPKYDQKFEFSIPIPSSMSEFDKQNIELSIKNAVKDFEKRLQNFHHSLFVDRIKLEYEMFLLRRDLGK